MRATELFSSVDKVRTLRMAPRISMWAPLCKKKTQVTATATTAMPAST